MEKSLVEMVWRLRIIQPLTDLGFVTLASPGRLH
jgi:hypothetical protein